MASAAKPRYSRGEERYIHPSAADDVGDTAHEETVRVERVVRLQRLVAHALRRLAEHCMEEVRRFVFRTRTRRSQGGFVDVRMQGRKVPRQHESQGLQSIRLFCQPLGLATWA